MPRLFFTDAGACAVNPPASPRRLKNKNWRADFLNAVRSFRDPSIPSQRIAPRHIATADAAPMPRATTNDAAPAFYHGREMAPASVRTRDEAIEAKRTPAPELGDEPGGTAELVASFPPGHVRNPAGGAYGSMDNEEGHHVMFYPGAPLDMGKTTANGTGAATIDGRVIRTEDLNPVTRDTNAKNRAFWARQQGR
jgi:hypothetical protein